MGPEQHRDDWLRRKTKQFRTTFFDSQGNVMIEELSVDGTTWRWTGAEGSLRERSRTRVEGLCATTNVSMETFGVSPLIAARPRVGKASLQSRSRE